MKIKYLTMAAVIAAASLAATGAAEARDQIKIVGSSTVFPFATAVAEHFGKTTKFKTPVVESTGSGGGMKLFCKGIGLGTPDITNASRRIKKNEFDKCTKAGIKITEVKIGFDGIVLANSKTMARMKLSKKQIFLALAKKVPDPKSPDSIKLIDNPYKKWSDIDASLPNFKIEVLGPPPTSGTRDAFSELALEGGAKTFGWMKALRKAKAGDETYMKTVKALGLNLESLKKNGKLIKGKNVFKKIAHAVREDGAYVEAGENDNLIIQKLAANPKAVGVFGFSFLDQNADKVQGALVDGADPTFENIASGNYGVSRSLFFYVKQAHIGQVPGIKEYIAAFTNENAWGDEGYLVDKGLIPLPEADRDLMSKSANSLAVLSM